jgi:hypothetical protein
MMKEIFDNKNYGVVVVSTKKEEKPMAKDKIIFESIMRPVQIQKSAVRCVLDKKVGIAPIEDHLTFSRELLAADYDNEAVRFKMTIVRI